MEYSDWPQWAVIFMLSLPVITWPLVAIAKKPVDIAFWIGGYVSVCSRSALLAYVLYAGGYWL